MKIPQLLKKSETKSCHNVTWTDDYSWVHQKNILEVLKDGSKLLPEVRKYLEEENKYTEFHLQDTKKFQKTLILSFETNIVLPKWTFSLVLAHCALTTKKALVI